MLLSFLSDWHAPEKTDTIYKDHEELLKKRKKGITSVSSTLMMLKNLHRGLFLVSPQP